MRRKISVIGAAIVDILAAGIDKEVFIKGSVPAARIQMSCGGDALNEAVVLSGLGLDTELVTILGRDDAGERVMECLRNNGVSTDKITITPDIRTGTNIVLVDRQGERYFITDPESTLRRLSKEHILPYCDNLGDIVSFASIFVSPKLGITDMEEVFRSIKEISAKGESFGQERILVADMTTAKNGETAKDLAPVLGLIDYLIPNAKEAEILTGEKDPEKAAEVLQKYGAKNVVIKCGKDGCVFRTPDNASKVPAFEADAIDTTGAGDSFVAGFIYGLSKGLSIEECCRYGNATASLIVTNYGTQGVITSPEQVEAILT